MKTVQENKLSMYETVMEVMDNHAAEIATVAALVTAKSDLVNKVVEIRAANTVQQKSTKGKTQDKGERKVELADTSYATAASVQAYAAESGNNDLYELVNFSRTRLRTADDEEIQQLCQLIHDEANTVVLNLADYGVDAAKLTLLQGLITAWSTDSQAPRVAISERAVATQFLPVLFSDADAIIKKRMDKLMEQFYTTNRIFYETYKKARKIVNAGHGSTTKTATVQGVVLNNLLNDPVLGASVEDTETGIDAETDVNGVFILEKIPLGVRNFRVGAPGFMDLSVDVDVTAEMGPVEFRLEPEIVP